MDSELFKKLNDDIWELRTLFNGICYRLLAFWDTESGALVIPLMASLRKLRKLPATKSTERRR